MNKYFKRVYVEITNVCNLNCSFCPKSLRTPEFMREELFERILNEVKPYCGYLYFHVMGEPLLHSGIGDFLDLCDEYGFFANITTNGRLLKQTADKIINKKALRLINFSLHSMDDNSNAGVDYLKNIFEFAQTAERERPDLIICFRLWNYSQKLSGKANKSIIADIKRFFNYEGDIQEIPQRGNGVKLRKNLYLSQSEKFDWPALKNSECSSVGSCLGLRSQIAILADGTVVPCCLDSEGAMKLGNIKESTLKEILNGKRAIDITRGFSENKLVEELCRKCPYRKRFDTRSLS